jgi:hypothetical protein
MERPIGMTMQDLLGGVTACCTGDRKGRNEDSE